MELDLDYDLNLKVISQDFAELNNTTNVRIIRQWVGRRKSIRSQLHDVLELKL